MDSQTENIYALTDKEVFARVVRKSIKLVCGEGALVVLAFLIAQVAPSAAKTLAWLILITVALNGLIVVWGTLLEIFLLTAGFASKRAPRRTKYDVGASLVRLAELSVMLIYGWLLYSRIIR